MNAPFTLLLPPHSIEAEQSLIGGLLLDGRAWDRIADLVSEADFYRDDHRRIFRHIGAIGWRRAEGASCLPAYRRLRSRPVVRPRRTALFEESPAALRWPLCVQHQSRACAQRDSGAAREVCRRDGHGIAGAAWIGNGAVKPGDPPIWKER